MRLFITIRSLLLCWVWRRGIIEVFSYKAEPHFYMGDSLPIQSNRSNKSNCLSSHMVFVDGKSYFVLRMAGLPPKPLWVEQHG